MIEMFSKANRLGIILGILLGWGIATAGAADQIAVWEVVTTYRGQLEGGRLTLMSDGKTSKGLPWTLIRDKVDFGREGSAVPRAGGAYYKGNWIGGWHLNGRVLMNGVTLKSEIIAPVLMPNTAGQSLIGTKPSIALKDSIVDLWEFVAVLPGTNTFIRLTCDFTPNKLVLDGDRKIGTYEFHGRSVIVNFVDPQFGRVAFMEKPDNVLTGKGKPVNRKYWKLQFIRVQRMAVYKTSDQKDFILYTNNRVNSPRYTPDYWTTFNWYFYTVGSKRHLACRSSEATLSAGGRELTWSGQKMVLIAGRPPR
ncbi:hypothetical protein [uncultured Gimesia sp.]|uniref:hypothetical protein n=1 Tax=uncultured Gimesia sp. TaxID=1678688 RepID=UPI0030DB37B8|tara:strand:+ start:41508 stop:42431 length:924 start_codon:yes stop_codon:yes gene_type:complete